MAFCVGCGEGFQQNTRCPRRFHSRQCYVDYCGRFGTCPECGKTYKKKPNQKYCSPDCSNQARRKVRMDICVGCGVSYMQKRPEQKYHSIECGVQARGSKNPGPIRKNPPKYSSELAASIIQAKQDGLSIKLIAEKFSVGRTTVWRVCRHV